MHLKWTTPQIQPLFLNEKFIEDTKNEVHARTNIR